MVMGDGGGRGGGIGDGWCNWCEVNNPSNFLFQEFGGYFINERLIRMLIVTRKNYVSQRDPPPPPHPHTPVLSCINICYHVRGMKVKLTLRTRS